MQDSATFAMEMISTTVTEMSHQRYCDLWNTRSSSADLDPSMTSADSLGCLATVASLQGQGHCSLPSTDGGSLDILAAAALIAGVPTDTSDSVCPIPTEDGPRGVKRKREDEDEFVSLEDDLYLSDDDDSDDDYYDGDGNDDYDGDDDDSENESDDVSIDFDGSSRTVDGCEVEFTDDFIGKEAFRVFQFGTDCDSSSESSASSDDSDDDDDDEHEDYDDDDDSEMSDEEVDCPESCACRSGSYVQLPPLSRRYKLISPLYKKLLKYRLLRNSNRCLYDCCEARCLRKWRRLPRHRVATDYHHDDLRVYNFRWGTWKPEDEDDEIFW